MRVQHALNLKGPLEPARINIHDPLRRPPPDAVPSSPGAAAAHAANRRVTSHADGSRQQSIRSTASDLWPPPALSPQSSRPNAFPPPQGSTVGLGGRRGPSNTGDPGEGSVRREQSSHRRVDGDLHGAHHPPGVPGPPKARVSNMKAMAMDMEGVGVFSLGPSPAQQRFGAANTVKGTTANFGRGNQLNINALLTGQSTRLQPGVLPGGVLASSRGMSMLAEPPQAAIRGRSSVLTDPSVHGPRLSMNSGAAPIAGLGSSKGPSPRPTNNDGVRPSSTAADDDDGDDGNFYATDKAAQRPSAMQRVAAPLQRAVRSTVRSLSRAVGSAAKKISRRKEVSIAPEPESAMGTANDMGTGTGNGSANSIKRSRSFSRSASNRKLLNSTQSFSHGPPDLKKRLMSYASKHLGQSFRSFRNADQPERTQAQIYWGKVRDVVMGENYQELTMAYKSAFPHAHGEQDPTKYLLMWKAARVDYIQKRLRGLWNPEMNKPPPKCAVLCVARFIAPFSALLGLALLAPPHSVFRTENLSPQVLPGPQRPLPPHLGHLPPPLRRL